MVSSASALLAFDGEGTLQAWSSGAQALLGYDFSEVSGSPLSLLLPTGDEDRTKIPRILRGETVSPFETSMLHKDGHSVRVSVTVTPLRDRAGQIVRILELLRPAGVAEPKLAEELDRERRLLRALIDSLPDSVFAADRDHITVACNKKLMESLGASSESEVVGRTVFDLFPARIAQALHEDDKRVLEGEEVLNREERLPTAGGGESWFLTIKSPLRDQVGSVVGLVGISRNIDRMKAAEAALRKSEARFRDITYSLGDWVWEIDADCRYTYVSEQVERVLGYSVDEVIGGTPFDFMPSTEARRVSIEFHEILETKKGFVDLPNDNQRKDGSIRHILTTGVPILGPDGQLLGYRGVDKDVTDRRRAEDAAEASERLARSTLDALAANVAIIEGTGVILSVNLAWRVFASENGVEPQKVSEGSNYLSICDSARGEDEAQAREFAAGIRSVLTGEMDRFEMEYPCHSPQEERWFVGRATRFTADGAVRAVIAHENVTARRLAEAALKRSQVLESLGTLAAGIAHEFNNILLAISGNTKLAIADSAPEGALRVPLAEIAKAAARAADLVSRISAFGSPAIVGRRPVALKDLVEESFGILRAALPAMIEIRTSFAPELPLVSCEPDAVRQCLVNLCTNSENAIGRRPGWIEISLDEERIEIATATPDLRPGRYVRLSVKDSGSGMDPQTLRRAFDPFFTTKRAGTGLGLSVIHGIMKSHGGAVTGESEPGKGATFRLYFPVPRGTGPHAVTADAVGGGNRILYVDDEEALVFLVQRLLSRAGFEVTTSSDPVQALALFQSDPGRFDALVTDLAMPSMSGFDLARRCLSIRPELHVILTTGFVGTGQTKEASEIGIREVILKPNTADELVDALAGLLRSGKGGPDRG